MARKQTAVDELRWQIRAAGIPPAETEYRFHPERAWRFDFAWPADRLAVEVEGGVSHAPVRSRSGKTIRGHHVHPEGYESDCIKYNAALLLGWRVIRVTPAMVKRGVALLTLDLALRGALWTGEGDG